RGRVAVDAKNRGMAENERKVGGFSIDGAAQPLAQFRRNGLCRRFRFVHAAAAAGVKLVPSDKPRTCGCVASVRSHLDGHRRVTPSPPSADGVFGSRPAPKATSPATRI